ncbi:hypothetical protein ANCCAN_30465 [Ancylostoma caninum]|uniref:Uncharacterized protein n=1 Tax=Ancylostoma caninum TaxID=29170 RepID=A0A368EW66_ANCCA|nr:hypothetical protein ANCCAN_30465 [Ancylostoma caninum]
MERSLINYMMCMHAHTTLFPQFESKVRNEAKQYLRDVERERDFRKQRAEAIKAGIIEDKYSDRAGVDSDEACF